MEDLDLLNGGRVQDGTDLEYLQVLGTGVGNGSLDTGVANLLELNVKRSSTLAHRGSAGQRGQESDVAKELHVGYMWL